MGLRAKLTWRLEGCHGCGKLSRVVKLDVHSYCLRCISKLLKATTIREIVEILGGGQVLCSKNL